MRKLLLMLVLLSAQPLPLVDTLSTTTYSSHRGSYLPGDLGGQPVIGDPRAPTAELRPPCGHSRGYRSTPAAASKSTELRREWVHDPWLKEASVSC
jgi:hypothetical protein